VVAEYKRFCLDCGVRVYKQMRHKHHRTFVIVDYENGWEAPLKLCSDGDITYGTLGDSILTSDSTDVHFSKGPLNWIGI
jgi:hypothetical protein